MQYMKIHTFKGGIHPAEMKELSKNCEICSAFPSTNTVWIPVTQGGAPNTPIVNVGDVVKRGQVIAKSDAFMSVPVHASVSGTVKKIENRNVTGNIEAQVISILSDNQNTEEFMSVLDPFACSKEEALSRVRDAGIVGMGGAAFPTHVKLSPPKDKKIEYVLANAAECEPYLTIDYRTIKETPQKLIDGLLIAMKITDAQKGLIVLEDNKKDLIPVIMEEIEKSKVQDKISVVVCKTKYPQGGEKTLVKAALNREIPVGKLPADIGCVIDNVGTLCAISDAFRLGKPLIDRAFTVSGLACQNPCNLIAPIGTLISDLIPEVVQLKDSVSKVIAGGPMMGFAMGTPSFPVQKNTSGVLLLTKKEAPIFEEDPCISCGCCISACPSRLTPVLMARSLQANDLQDAKRYGLMDCIECGSCAWVCPAHIQLVQRFRLGKNLVRQEMASKGGK